MTTIYGEQAKKIWDIMEIDDPVFHWTYYGEKDVNKGKGPLRLEIYEDKTLWSKP